MGHGSKLCLENLKVMVYITLFSVLLILFIQSLHRKIPTVTIEQLYIPTLNQTATAGDKNITIYFDLKLDNKNPVGIYYRPMNLTFSYFKNFENIESKNNNSKNNNSSNGYSVPVCVYTLRGFHQEHHKIRHVRDRVVVTGGMAVGGGRVVVMRVDLVGRVKFKSIAQWKRSVRVGVDVEVDRFTGEKVVKSGIRLVRSGGGGPVVGFVLPVAMVVVFSGLFDLMLL